MKCKSCGSVRHHLYECPHGDNWTSLNAKVKQIEVERNSAFDAIAKLTVERDRYREALETVKDVLSYLPVGFMGICGDVQTGETWPCEDELFDTINTALEGEK
jgi:hypothetical protein